MKKILLPTTLILLFLSMLSFPQLTKAAALEGLNLWFSTLVPTLLPFMIISSAIMETGSYNIIAFVLRPIMKYLFKLPPNSGYPFFMGLLCGFPIGSKVTADMVISGHLTRSQGEILLSFCNNISPAFIISYLATYILNLQDYDSFFIISILLLSPILSGIIMSRIITVKNECHHSPSKYISIKPPIQPKNNIIDACIIKSFESIIKLCGYIILFTILSNLCSLFIDNKIFYSTIAGLLEITSGLSLFRSLPETSFTIIAACTLTAFGGICTIAQTYSMISESGLRLKVYIAGKGLNSLIVLLLSSLYIFILK